MFVPKLKIFIEWEDAKIFLVRLSSYLEQDLIAAAFSKTGLTNEVANYIFVFNRFYSVISLILIIAVWLHFTTEITSNTALISIALQ